MKVYTISTQGGQIIEFEAVAETLPVWLEQYAKEQFSKQGYFYGDLGTGQFICYPTKDAANMAIKWALQ